MALIKHSKKGNLAAQFGQSDEQMWQEYGNFKIKAHLLNLLVIVSPVQAVPDHPRKNFQVKVVRNE